MWEKHPRIFFRIAKKADPAFISRGLLLNQAYEEEFSQIILPYNTKEYTINQAKEILMKYASIYPVVVKHMKEYKKMVDNDLESTISEIQSSNLYKENKPCEKELYGDFCEKNRTNKTTIDALSIYMAFTTFMIEIWKSHKKTFWQIPSETDPSQIKGQISVDAAYEEEFSQVILPYNAKEYTINQAKEILMKYASIYPVVVKHMKEYKKMVDNDLESTISEIQSSNLYKENKPCEKELYGDFCEKNRTNKTTIDALSIYMAFTTFMIEIWKSHKKTFWQIPSETDPSQIKGQISVDAAYEEEFSQVILPYNAKEYTIDQAKEILMKYASIYPVVVKHMKEYKKMVDKDLESTISEIQSSNLYKEKKPYEKELYGDFN